MSNIGDINKSVLEQVKAGRMDKLLAFQILKEINTDREQEKDDIAIIGMACRFPGARNVEEFWDNLKNGVNSIGRFPIQRIKVMEGAFSDPADAEFMEGTHLKDIENISDSLQRGGYLDEIDKFDAPFFRISPKEAKFIDPLQRVFLETAWEAVEDAGYGGSRIYGTKTGVFAGRDNTYPTNYRFLTEPDQMHLTGSWAGILATRISYIFDLHGPGMVIDTACSSGLTAVHEACQALRNRECEMALAGGIHITLMPNARGRENPLGMVESGDSRVRTFDKNANGTVWSEGAGVVILKPLRKALEDRDNIYAVIKGSAVNNDGASNGITAPSANAQEEVITRAWEEAKIDPETISYIEAHGTGTVLGDPIEIAGLTSAFRKYTQKNQFCGVGSVKTGIGHLVGASGIASMMKVVLALNKGLIPPSINFEDPNPFISFCDSPVYVTDKLTEWEGEGGPRRAGISSLGFSGTNCHVVVEQAPSEQVLPDDGSGTAWSEVLTISAKNERVLWDFIRKYGDFLDKDPKPDIRDRCYTANTGRGHFTHRLAIIAKNAGELEEKIRHIIRTGLENIKDEGIYIGEHKVVPGSKTEREKGEITEGEKRRLTKAALGNIKELSAAGDGYNAILGELCSLYAQGADFDWEEVYKGQGRRRVSIPVYPLERISFWASPRAQEIKAAQNPYYEIGWVPAALKSGRQEAEKGRVLIFKDEKGLGDEITQKFRDEGREVVEVEFGPAYGRISMNKYIVGGSGDDYRRLLEDAGGQGFGKIVHLFSISEGGEIEDAAGLEDEQKRGVYSLFHLARALGAYALKDGIDIILVSDYAFEVTGEEQRINPHNAALFGLSKVVGREDARLRCRCIDIDGSADAGVIFPELAHMGGASLAAYRKGARYVEEFREARGVSMKGRELGLKSDGVYIITGGMGGIGLEIGKYLASKSRISLCLVNRSGLPGRSEWDGILERNENSKLCGKIRAVREMEQAGTNIECLNADVSNEEELKALLDGLREKYGRINGIIHCAGAAGDGFLIRKDEEAFKRVMSPKVRGVWLLNKLSEGDNPDFFVMFSSIISLTGEAGQGDYAAANSYMDSFAAYMSKQGRKATAINWPAWSEVGMAVDYGAVSDDMLFKPISTARGLEAFERLMSFGPGRIIPADLNYKLLSSIEGELPIRVSGEIEAQVYRREQTPKPDTVKAKRSGTVVKGKGSGEYSAIEKTLAQIWADVLGLAQIDIYENFHDLGGDSILASKLLGVLEEEYPGLLNMTDIYSHPSVVQLAKYIGDRLEGTQEGRGGAGDAAPRTSAGGDIAVIGMACRLPGAGNVDRYWEQLKNGVCSITDFPENRLRDIEDFYPGVAARVGSPGSRAGYLEEIDKFDAGFFRISPREATLMEPAQRLFLEAAYEAIEDGGYGNRINGTRTGVYAGIDSSNKTQYINMLGESDLLAITGSVTGILASRISYILNLRGPGLVIDTACSSGLVALHEACVSLKIGECDMAVAGGICVNIHPQGGDNATEIESGTGETRAFDRTAKGTVWGEGVVTLLLKPLQRAIEDRDNIHAVIKGSAINNDGASNGITAPNPEAQTDVITRAWEEAKIDPETISYIETHGTGTILGDPIEIKGLTGAFREYTDRRQFCGIGSVKTNIGHTVGASGLASLLKAVLALKNGQIPASLNFKEPNPLISFDDSPLYVNDRHREWAPGELPRRAGVSAFGFSGTNCHVVLEEYTQEGANQKADALKPYILALSARSREALKEQSVRYLEYLDKGMAADLADICYTADTGRGHYGFRLAVVTESAEDLKEKLAQISRRLNQPGFEGMNGNGIYCGEHSIVSGNREAKGEKELTGAQRAELNEAVGAVLKRLDGPGENYEVLQEEICRLYIKGADIDWDEIFKGQDRRRISIPVYPLERTRFWPKARSKAAAAGDMETGHPLLDKLLTDSADRQVYMTKLSPGRHWVLQDHMIMGNNVVPGTTYLEIARKVGERYFKENQAELRDVIFMVPLAVGRDEEKEVHTIVKKEKGHLEFIIASRFEPGAPEEEEGWVIHAEGRIFKNDDQKPHGHNIEEIKKRCGRNMGKVDMSVTGRTFKFGPRWWNVEDLSYGENEILIKLELPRELLGDLNEYGIHPGLMDNAANVASQNIVQGMYLPLSYGSMKIYRTMPGRFYSWQRIKGDLQENAETISMDISLMDEDGEVFAEIENYIIKRVNKGDRMLKTMQGRDNLYHSIGWAKQELKADREAPDEGGILIFKDGDGMGDEIVRRLMAEGREVIEAEIGQGFAKVSENKYIISTVEEDYQRLLAEVEEKGLSQVIHLMSAACGGEISDAAALEEKLERGVYSLFRLTRAVVGSKIRNNIDLVVISDYANEVTGDEKGINPHNAALCGLGRVIGQEYPNLKCRFIDIDSVTPADRIISELGAGTEAYAVAYRGDARYVEEFRKADIGENGPAGIEIKDGGVYVITGGTGGIGLEIGRHLASRNRVRLALINRSRLPGREKWDEILAADEDPKACGIIKAIREMEESGSEVACFSADVSRQEELEAVLDEIRSRYGRINGIIHGAGRAGDGFVIRKDEKLFRDVLAPKVQGTWLLDRLTGEDSLDFMIMFSSVAAVMGGPGQGDYTAANSYMDAYAVYRARQGKRTLAINWPAWRETGMAADYGAVDDDGLFKPLATASAINLFEGVLNSGLTRVIPAGLNYRLLASFKGELPVRISKEIKEEIEKRRTLLSWAGRAAEGNPKQPEVKVKGKEKGSFSEIEKRLAQVWADVLGLAQIDIYESFHDMGGDSLLASRLLKAVDEVYPGMLGIADIYTYSTVVQMAGYIQQKKGEAGKKISVKEANGYSGHTDIAIIGMACRFPGANNIEQYWHNLRNRVNSIGSFPETRMEDIAGFYQGSLDAKGGYLDDISRFDAGFFRIPPREAALMDPVQRVFLETAYGAIEDGGYGGGRLNGTRVGVYAGIDSTNRATYSFMLNESDMLVLTGSWSGILASRISYILNLKGPGIVVDTACSSGLVALHEACLSIKNNECTMALAGGISIFVLPKSGPDMTGIESGRGQLRSFDRNAAGTVWSEGVGTLLLKPLDKALEDRDNIYAVIKGSAINNDGASNGITAPNPEAQTDVIMRAWEDAGIDPETISYIEAHGTGTELGDPIEIKGLTDAFRQYTDKRQFCGIGSVKTNIGHSIGASGIASLIKVALAIKNGEIPASLNFEEPNQYINFSDSPVYVNDKLKEWKNGDTPRRAGVSAFGFSGTNCHVVLEEYALSAGEQKTDSTKPYILALSGRSREALREQVDRYIEFLDKRTEGDHADICYTADTGRGHYSFRLAAVIQSREDMREKLAQIGRSLKQSDFEDIKVKGVYYGEHRIVPLNKEAKGEKELTEAQKVELSRKADAALESPGIGENGYEALMEEICLLYVKGADINWDEIFKGQHRKRISIPLYPLERVRYWPRPKGMAVGAGHPLLNKLLTDSINEQVYMTSFSVDRHWVLEDHMVMGSNVIPGTTYLEIAREIGTRYFRDSRVVLSDIVFQTSFSVARGEEKEVRTIAKKEKEHLEFIIASRLQPGVPEGEEGWIIHAEGRIYKNNEDRPTAYNIEEIRKRCTRDLGRVDMSAVKGAFKFGPRWRNVENLSYSENETLARLELPRELLGDMKEYGIHPALMDNAANLGSHSITDGMYLPLSYGRMRIYGAMPANFYSFLRMKGEAGKTHETVSFDITMMDDSGEVFAQIENYTIKRVNQEDRILKRLQGRDTLYYGIGWRPKELRAESGSIKAGAVLVFKGEGSLGDEIVRRLKAEGREIIEAEIGQGFAKSSESKYIISRVEEDYERLLAEVEEKGLSQVIHLMSMAAGREISDAAGLEEKLDMGVYSLYRLTRALVNSRLRNEIDLVLVSGCANEVTGEEEAINPHNAALCGLGRVIGQEYANLKCRFIDIDSSTPAESIISELGTGAEAYAIAYRGDARYVEEFRKADIGENGPAGIEIKEAGVYVITGGTGGIGLEIGRYLASRNRVRLALINRSRLPEREVWEEILAAGQDMRACFRIKAIKEMEESGAEVTCFSADVSKKEELEAVLDEIRSRYGRINGIIHSAGMAGEGFIIRKDEKLFRDVLAPKVKGTWLLDRLTEEDNPDFLVMFSSVTAITGRSGQGDYTAANAYMDAYAAYRARQGKRTLAINWPAWLETGMAVDYGAAGGDTLFMPIATASAVKAFEETLNSGLTRVVPTRLNYRLLASFKGELPIGISEEIKTEIKRKSLLSGAVRAEERKPVQAEVKVKGRDGESYSEIEKKLAQIWADVLGLAQIDIYESFHDMGGDSLMAASLLKAIGGEYTGLVNIADIYTYPSIVQMAGYIQQKKGETGKKRIAVKEADAYSGHRDIAVIGMACRFPGANNTEQYWNNLRNRVNSIGRFPETRMEDIEGFYRGSLDGEFGYLDDISRFDAAFFRIPPREAALMDPVQRVFLETVYEALEDGGYGGGRLNGTRTGVYAGVDSTNRAVYSSMLSESGMLSMTGTWSSILASRVSYILNLRGPGIVVDTACSSGLVALHGACQALKHNECTTAIAGGINIFVLPRSGPGLTQIESTNGQIRSFDKGAGGTVWAEGVGALLLKPLDKALEDKDNIYAVIKGSAINNDGASNGITAPNPEAQTDAIIRAWEEAGIDPETISYIEAHGTGTELGDPIEIKGLTDAFRQYTDKRQFCGIGSVKTNIGHAIGASGIASFIKVVLALKAKEIPASLNFEQPNPYINFSDSPLYINSKLRKWAPGSLPRRAGVSAFGFSGTNCHVVLEEMPEAAKQPESIKAAPQVFTISARSRNALKELINKYIEYLNANEEQEIGNICYTANTGRGHYNCRLAVTFGDREELLEKLVLAGQGDLGNKITDGIYYDEHKTVSASKQEREEKQLTEEQKRALGEAAAMKMELLPASGEDYAPMLDELCRLYVRGADIKWEEIYRGQDVRRVRLPVYPFEKARYWPEPGAGTETNIPESENTGLALEGQQAGNSLYHEVGWVPMELKTAGIEPKMGSIIVFKDDKGIGDEIILRLRAEGREVIEVEYGQEYAGNSESGYIIRPVEGDYERLAGEIENRRILQAVYLAGLTGPKAVSGIGELEELQERGVYGMFHLLRALSGSRLRNGTDVVIISDYAYRVTGNEEEINPHNAALSGLGRVVGQEFTSLSCRFIDIDANTDADLIMPELESGGQTYMTAYRNGIRYIEEFRRTDVQKLAPAEVEIKESGIYVITGGTGGMGLEMGRWLASKNRVNLCLISRSKLPERETWDEILAVGQDVKMCGRIEAIRKIEEAGARVICRSADVSDPEGMMAVLDELRSSFGRINGIIHSAGIAGMGLLVNKDEKRVRELISAKMQGTWLLGRLTEEDSPDFFVMFSSIAAFLGGPGQGDYAAANSYMDSFAEYRARQGKKTLSINWPMWDETGMATDHGVNADGLFRTIITQKAVNAFNEVLNRDTARITIGEVNYSSELFGAAHSLPIEFSGEIREEINKARRQTGIIRKKKEKKKPLNVKVTGRADENYSGTEKKIARIWGEELGFEEVNIYDNFYELGGDSITAMNVVNSLNEQVGIKLKATEFLKYPTVERFAKYLDEEHTAEIKSQDEGDSPNVNKIENKWWNSSTFEVDRENVKELKIALQREITIAMHRTLPLCVILADDRLRPWYYEHYVNIYSQIEGSGNIKLDFLEPWATYKDVLDEISLGADLLEKEDDILDFINRKISLGYYMNICVDEYYLPGKVRYGKTHFIHHALVYGYDNINRKVATIGYNSQYVLDKIAFDYEVFSEAYEKGKAYYAESAPWAFRTAVQLFLPKWFDRGYPFSVNRFLRELNNYISSTGESSVIYAWALQEDKVECGSRVQDVVVQHLERLLQGARTIDYRAMHLLYEHKNALQTRLEYIISRYDITERLVELTGKYQEIVEKFRILRLKAFDTEYVEFKEEVVREIVYSLNSFKEEEKVLLDSIYEELKSIFQERK